MSLSPRAASCSLELLDASALLRQHLVAFTTGRELLLEILAAGPFLGQQPVAFATRRELLLELLDAGPLLGQSFLVCRRQPFRLLQRPAQIGQLLQGHLIAHCARRRLGFLRAHRQIGVGGEAVGENHHDESETKGDHQRYRAG